MLCEHHFRQATPDRCSQSTLQEVPRQPPSARRTTRIANDDQHLAGGGEAQGDAPLAQPADDGAGLGAVLQELAGGVQLQAAFAQVAQEGRVLVHDPDDAEPLAGSDAG